MRDLWAAPLDLRRALGFGLCVADSFGEHLATQPSSSPVRARVNNGAISLWSSRLP
jgi:hypothetical protein